MEDYYKILGIKETASAEEIHARWIELMQTFHPDHRILAETDEERAKEINEAYHVLKHSSTRMEYDFERQRQRSLTRLSVKKLILPASVLTGLTFLCILSLLFLLKPQAPPRLQTKSPLTSSQPEWSMIPNYEPGPYPNAPKPGSKQEPGAKVEKKEKVISKHEGKEIRTVPSVPEKKSDFNLRVVRSRDSVRPPLASQSKEFIQPISIEDLKSNHFLESREKISGVHSIPDPIPSVKGVDQVAELTPSPFISTEEEVKQFFANYIERYSQKDTRGFLSLFSPKAIQNQRDGLEGIQRIYDNFFSQSRELQYHMEETEIEFYENTVEVDSRYEVDQTLRKRGDKKVWRGKIHWTLMKENGVLKIVSLNYKHESEP